MSSSYKSGKIFRYLFIFSAIIIVIVSLWVTNSLVDELKDEERKKIELWAETISVMTSQAISNETFLQDIDPRSYKGFKQYFDNAFNNYDSLFITRIIEGNTTIPLILTDEFGEISSFRNVLSPEQENIVSEQDSIVTEIEKYDMSSLIDQNREYLQDKIKKFANKHAPIVVKINEEMSHYVYYDDSTLLKRLQVFPYIQLSVVFIFIIISFFALNSTKKAEQNRVWVGLSKETSYQLGTPISSLMAWLEFLKTKDIDAKLLTEIDKDVQRLKTIAERFSKIGSNAKLEPMDLKKEVANAVEYLERRISSKVNIRTHFPKEPVCVLMNEALFSWVIENLVKNAVDAMDGQGIITISALTKKKKVIIDVADTGKGIPKSKFDTIFHPGYTTKQRGWGLGLSLVKRIIESYHKGKIYVYKSEIKKGTTFRIELKTIG